MTPDSGGFRRTMGLFATGVTVLAVERGGVVHGMTANAVTSLSLDPLLILVCVGKQTRTAALLGHVDGFALNILREDQEDLSVFFAGLWGEAPPPPFQFVPWEGGPRLMGCLASIGCRKHQLLEGGDHWIVVGRVVALHRGTTLQRPLIFYGGRYVRLAPPRRRS